MDEFLGKKYISVRSENFDEYLEFLGVGFLPRKAAVALKMTYCLKRNEDGTYTFEITSAIANSSITFKLGEEFVEDKPGLPKVNALITIEGNKMIHIQTEDSGRKSTHVREFFPDKMITTTTCDGFDKVAIREHELVK